EINGLRHFCFACETAFGGFSCGLPPCPMLPVPAGRLMARRRLPPPPVSDDAAMTPELEPKSRFSLGGTPALNRPPVARVAAESAAESALRDVSAELASLRAEGRMVLRLPLEAIEDGWLIRDRIATDPEDMAA